MAAGDIPGTVWMEAGSLGREELPLGKRDPLRKEFAFSKTMVSEDSLKLVYALKLHCS